MPLVIKEINVSTTVEKKVVLPEDVSYRVYERMKKDILEELSLIDRPAVPQRKSKER